MSETISLLFDKNGIAKVYDDTFDISVHCESEEEQNKVFEILNRRWIPVCERLPEEETDVLVCNSNGNIEIASGSYSTELSTHDFIWYTSGWRFGKVKAWMPLPEPYKIESEDKECR